MFSSSSASIGKFPSSFATNTSSSSLSCSSTSSASSISEASHHCLRWRRDDFVPNSTNLPPIFKKVLKNTKAGPERMIFSFLPLKELARFSQASSEANRITVPFLRVEFSAKIRKAKEAFKEIIAFDPIDENRLNDGVYCAETWVKMLREIKADPMIRQIFEANNEDLEKTAQAIKDRDLLICFREFVREAVPFFPGSFPIVEEIEDDFLPLAVQAARVRTWIEDHQNDPPFLRHPRMLELRNLGLRTIPMEFVSKFTNLGDLILPKNEIQVIPDSLGR